MDTRLLVLDDEQSMGDLILRIARVSDFEARYTPSPEEFFASIEQWQPTHIAIDLVMPEMDGVEVIEQLAALSVRAQLIVISGVGSRVLDAAARSAAHHGLEIIGVLSKPFKPNELRELVSKKPAQDNGGRSSRGDQQQEVSAADIEQGLEENQFSLVYQPKINCADGSVAGFEVLSRWIHPEYGFIPPDYFIVKAEEFGLIDRLTFQVIERSLSWFSRNYPRLDYDYSLSINVSGKNLAESRLIEVLPEYCKNYNVARDKLILELTETAAMEDPVKSLDLLTRLRVKDFHLSIDDFGTGFSSMLQLVKLPFSEVKIDKSFVFTALKSEESRAVIQVTLDLARRLGLKTTAEGVEDQATFEYLREQGCELVQGYHFARPLPGEEAVHWVQEWEPLTQAGA